MAMGNYPYASSYLLHGESLLPAWPVRAACSHLAHVDAATASDATLFAAVREAAATLHNNTGAQQCFNITGQPRGSEASSRRFMTSPMSRRPPLEPATRRRAADGAQGKSSAAPGSAAAVSDDTKLDAGRSCLGSWGYQWCTEMTQPVRS